MLTSLDRLDEYFFQLYNFQWINLAMHRSFSLAWQFVHAVLEHGDFLNTFHKAG